MLMKALILLLFAEAHPTLHASVEYSTRVDNLFLLQKKAALSRRPSAGLSLHARGLKDWKLQPKLSALSTNSSGQSSQSASLKEQPSQEKPPKLAGANVGDELAQPSAIRVPMIIIAFSGMIGVAAWAAYWSRPGKHSQPDHLGSLGAAVPEVEPEIHQKVNLSEMSGPALGVDLDAQMQFKYHRQDDGPEEATYAVGDYVMARYMDGLWYDAEISKDHGDGTYTLLWDDGNPNDQLKETIDIKAAPVPAPVSSHGADPVPKRLKDGDVSQRQVSEPESTSTWRSPVEVPSNNEDAESDGGESFFSVPRTDSFVSEDSRSAASDGTRSPPPELAT
mmetsp:Transcript_42968/g.93554  ORF Transcript_42968/g.93554 Transcript_42968/m.93554 type:complete len:335 (+) Transcript_42968:77-1081(+)